jgi:hypothetical protein
VHLDWKNYEVLTAFIYKSLGQVDGIEILGYGNTCKVTGESGVSHQVDVLTKHGDGTQAYRTAIECKYWNKKVSKDVVMKLDGILTDCEIDKGIIVSKNGFTRDGKKYAKHRNIELVRLHEAGKPRPSQKLGEIFLDQTIQRTRVEFAHIKLVDQTLRPIPHHEFKSSVVQTETGEQIPFMTYVNDFTDKLGASRTQKRFTKFYGIAKGNYLGSQGKPSEKILGIKLTGSILVSESPWTFELVDTVLYSMIEILEDKEFVITKHGYILEKS